VAVDEVDAVRLDDRQHAVGDALVLLVAPVLPLLAGDQIGRAREGRYPAGVHETRVPADVIDVEMRADDDVDLLGPETGGGKAVEEIAAAHVPERRSLTVLVVADAGVDEYGRARGPDDPGLDTRAEISRVLVPEVGPQPPVMARDGTGGRVGQHRRRGERRACDLHDGSERDVAEDDRWFKAHGR